MLFNEIYGCYYGAVARILAQALQGGLDEKKMREICADEAFAESAQTIIPALKSGRWQLLRQDMTTPLSHKPDLPPTDVQLRWLKAVTLDPRIALFDTDGSFFAEDSPLKDVEPLFTPQDISVTDRYANGDPFTDPNYIKCFRTLFAAVKNGSKARVTYRTEKSVRTAVVSPYLFEYSEREDRLRLWVNSHTLGNIINVCRVEDAELLSEAGDIPDRLPALAKEQVTLEVSDSRMAVERALLHFAHYERETELTENGCILRITYCKADRTELAQQVLSFGPLVRVTHPQEFAELIRARLNAQRNAGLQSNR